MSVMCDRCRKPVDATCDIDNAERKSYVEFAVMMPHLVLSAVGLDLCPPCRTWLRDQKPGMFKPHLLSAALNSGTISQEAMALIRNSFQIDYLKGGT
jgi:hypothetical protein